MSVETCTGYLNKWRARRVESHGRYDVYKTPKRHLPSIYAIHDTTTEDPAMGLLFAETQSDVHVCLKARRRLKGMDEKGALRGYTPRAIMDYLRAKLKAEEAA